VYLTEQTGERPFYLGVSRIVARRAAGHGRVTDGGDWQQLCAAWRWSASALPAGVHAQ
jgi:hypothetical protein